MIGAAIYSILVNTTAITDIVGQAIYPEIAPQGKEMPFVIYQIDEVIPETTKDGPSCLDTYSINLIVFGKEYDELSLLSQEIRTALDRYRGIVEGVDIDQGNFKGFESGYDTKANVFVQESEYDMRINI